MKRIHLILLLAGGLLAPSLALAEDATVTTGQFVANNVWMMLCAGLVFIMHLGFATLESGLTRAKNTTNILFKNTFIISAGILTYALMGFNLMYPGDFSLGSFFGFAGSTLVHSVGGWGALAGAWLLGPRLGKYVGGKLNPIPGSNMPMAAVGVFLLWLGWFGFNGGSVLSADPGATSFTLVTTCLAAAAGALGAMFTSWFCFGKPDLSMALNGVLAGLVGITAGAPTTCRVRPAFSKP